jgi:excisionase family DNA binding protein
VNRTQFVTLWSERLKGYRTIPAFVNAERLCAEVLADFAQMCQAEDEAVLSLQEAAAASGYSRDHLRRLVRLGRLPAHRRGRFLLFRNGDLPRKLVMVDGASRKAYDARADARRVATRRHEGGTHG